MLGVEHLAGARELVRSKVGTSELRDTDDFGAQHDAKEDTHDAEDEMDAFARAPGRDGNEIPPQAVPRELH